eukprot:4291415-Pyramimonas_sp.AAC.1
MPRHAPAYLARPCSSSGHRRSPSWASASRSVTKHWCSGKASSPSLIARLSARPTVCAKCGQGPEPRANWEPRARIMLRNSLSTPPHLGGA